MQSLITRLRDRLLQPSRTRQPKGPREHVRLTNPWHAVSIAAGPQACGAATEFSGRRFLARGPDARDRPPPLPLPGCDARTCGCRYQHHADRRLASRAGRTVAGAPRPTRRADDAQPG